MTGIILEFYELEKIYYQCKISSRKNDSITPKLKRILDAMKKSQNPVCTITVEES
jgi:hypothetical protein